MMAKTEPPPKPPKTKEAILSASGARSEGLGYSCTQNPSDGLQRALTPEINHVSKGGQSAGKPSAFTKADKEAAYFRYVAGDSATEIARDIGCTARTVRNWVAHGGWRSDLADKRETVAGLEGQILRLSKRTNLDNAAAQRLAVLTKALERMKKLAPKPKPRPVVANAVSKDALAKVLDASYGLYKYQVEFLLDDSRFRCVLKARQTGFSYIVGLAVLLGAMAGRPQIVVSASELQAQIILNYVRHHAGRLGVVIEADKSRQLTIDGVHIIAVTTNFRTAQGWPGDVWFDEFAWVHNQRMLWAALVPSITAVGGRVTVFSTPFLPGSLFWELATNHRGLHSHFSRHTLTIHDAIAQGMPLPGGLDELRMLFDSESWAMFYECQWAEDGSSLLPWKLLHEIATNELNPAHYGRLQAGVDVGRINDRTAIALIGQKLEREKWLDQFALTHHEMHQGMPFAQQKATITTLDDRMDIEKWRIDKTGLGFQLSEELETAAPARFEGVWFSAQRKAKLALNLLKLCEEKRLLLPNDPTVLAQMHSVKKIISGEKIKYDAARGDDGHGDLFWAVALAADGRSGRHAGGGIGVEVL
jgi:phage FluMu gp28-like protein